MRTLGVVATFLVLLTAQYVHSADTDCDGFTRGDVAKHNTPEYCLMIIWNTQPGSDMNTGGVYDLTTFAEFHPGGADVIHAQCGKEVKEWNSKGTALGLHGIVGVLARPRFRKGNVCPDQV